MRRPLLLACALAFAGCAEPDAPAETAPEPPPTVQTAATSAEVAAQGALAVGDRAPDFALPDATGRTVRLSERLAEGPVVLTFYRGAWCPYCNTSLRQFQEALPEIRAAGADLLAVSPQTPEGSREAEQAGGLAFPVLSDVGNRVSRDYGLVFTVPAEVRERYLASGIDLERANGSDAWELPVPATYIIGRDGTVRYAFVEADYTQRAAPRDVLGALRGLG
jgi:peroxiredoxin